MLLRMIARFLAVALFALAAPSWAHAQVAEASRQPVVVELYTSQGCGQCRRANRLLGVLAREPNVIALTFPVGYWDYLGWRDTFAQPEFTERQRNFSRTLRFRGLSTPQLVIDGVRQAGADDWDLARATVEEVKATPRLPGAPSVSIERIPGGRVRATVGAGRTPVPADVWFLAFDPGPFNVMITHGENARRSIAHYNLVRWIRRAGSWNGAATYFEAPRCATQCAVIVQGPNGGPVLGAAMTARER
ncbi:MAG: DUF1223 domain-containing protein [Hyphomonadaceae bacterium]